MLSLGTYTRDETDLTIRTTGFGITVGRSYDSGRAVDGPMGIGWVSSLTSRLHYSVYALSGSTYQHRAVIVMPHGGIYEFTRNSPTGAFTPPVGRRDTLVQNGDGTYDMTLGNSRTVLHFNADGTLSSMKDEYNNVINYTYDGNGRVQRVADGAGSGRYVDVTWNTATGRIASVTDSAARTVRYTYDAAGNLQSVADAVTPVGEQSSKYYYVPSRFRPLLSRVEDRWDRIISRIEWDAGDRVTSYTDGEYNDANPAASTGEKYRYTYSPNSTTPTTIRSHSLGNKSFTYTAATGLKTNDGNTYSSSGQVLAAFDEDGRSTNYTYDSSGRVLTETVHGNFNTTEVVWTYTYDPAFPDKIATKKPNNPNLWAGTRFEYWPPGSPAPGALKKVYQIRTDGVTEDLAASNVYDSRGRLTSSAATGGNPSVTYTYDAAGNLVTVTRGSVQVHLAYDALGRLTKRTDEMGEETTYTYDAADRVLTTTLPKISAMPALDFTTTFTYDDYDAVSQLTFVKTTDPNGRVTKRGYDALGNLGKSVDALQNATTYTYQYNLLKSITDANGNTTSYAYDVSRQLMATTFPDGKVESYTRGSRGRLNSVTDRRGVKMSYGYDAFGRLTSAVSDQFSPSGGTYRISYSYEGQKLKLVTDQMVSPPKFYDFTHDNRFQVATEGYSGEMKVEYERFSSGIGDPPKSYTLRPPAGNNDRVTTVSYTYDSRERVRTISFGGPSPDVTISYNDRDQYDEIEFGNGMVRNYTYDDQGRLTRVTHTHPTANTIARYDYNYDFDHGTSTYTMLGQRVTMDPVGADVTKYRYDAAYQLIEELTAPGSYKRFHYDAIGNRTAIEYPGGAMQTFEYHKNGTNPGNSSRLKKAFGNTILTYDDSGNQQNFSTWDIANRLTQYGSTSFAYDWRSRRTKRQTASYFYVGEDVARIRDSALGVLDDFIFGPGVDEPLVRMRANGAKSYYVVDGLGSVVAVVDSTGAVTESEDYDAWGSANSPLTFGYTGRETGVGTLLYYRARYYESATGRFISEDPLGMDDGPNVYRYVKNSPVFHVDPSGLKTCRCTRRLGFQVGPDWFAGFIPKFWIAEHEYIQIVPDGSFCGGNNGIAWGYQNQGGKQGMVEPEQSPSVGESTECSAVPCIDENKLKGDIYGQIGKTGPYEAVCTIGKGWNQKNCQGWVDAMLANAKKPNCCDGLNGGGW
jgi:RHS repeat-associated protein